MGEVDAETEAFVTESLLSETARLIGAVKTSVGELFSKADGVSKFWPGEIVVTRKGKFKDPKSSGENETRPEETKPLFHVFEMIAADGSRIRYLLYPLWRGKSVVILRQRGEEIGGSRAEAFGFKGDRWWPENVEGLSRAGGFVGHNPSRPIEDGVRLPGAIDEIDFSFSDLGRGGIAIRTETSGFDLLEETRGVLEGIRAASYVKSVTWGEKGFVDVPATPAIQSAITVFNAAKNK